MKDLIIAALRAPLVETALRLIAGEEAASVRKSFRVAFGTHAVELIQGGLRKDQLGNAEALVWDSVVTVLQRFGGMYLGKFTELNPGKERPATVADALRSMHATFSVIPDEYSSLVGSLVDSALEGAAADIARLPFEYAAFARLPFSEEGEPLLGRSTVLCSNPDVRVLLGAWGGNFDRSELDPSSLQCAPDETWQQGQHDPEWNDHAYYLSFGANGYIARESSAEDLLLELRSELKAVLGLSLACDLLDVQGPPAWDHVEPVYIFSNMLNDPPIRWLPMDESAVIGALVARKVDDSSLGEMRRSWHAIGAAARRRDQRVMNAGRWLFESYSGSNGLLQLVQATVALEILLGGDGGDIQRLLANRAAYLIAVSASERDELLNRVKKIYAARSNIVHSGTNDLGDESRRLDEARAIVKRVIKKELALFTVV